MIMELLSTRDQQKFIWSSFQTRLYHAQTVKLSLSGL